MTEQYTFGMLKIGQLVEALELVRDVFYKYEAPEYSREGIQEFMRFIEPEEIEKLLMKNAMCMWICEDKGRVIGTLAACPDHIYLLFVNGKYHRKGIARRLFDYMIEHFDPPEVTVNSSLYAHEAYRKLGFVDTDVEQLVNGIRFIPMKYAR